MTALSAALLLSACSQSPLPTPQLISTGHARAQGSPRPLSARAAQLEQTALTHAVISVRGEAIVSLSQMNGTAADHALVRLTEQADTPLVQTWAAAARVQRADSTEELLSLAPLLPEFPALSRPILLQLERLPTGSFSVTDGLTMAAANAELQSVLLPMLQQQDGAAVMAAMLRHPTVDGRRMAAGLLANMAQGNPNVRQDILDGMAFLPGATAVPWAGGPLYIPGASWNPSEARALVRSLVSWHVFCTQNNATAELQQINNNLRSVGLLQMAGFPRSMPADTHALLSVYGQHAGADALRTLLSEQGLTRQTPYQTILTNVEG